MIAFSCSASVTIMGSRIIYPSDAATVDVRLKNNDPFPYIIQAWFDDGNIDSGPDIKGIVPFIVTPPLFRIQPDSGQIVRVVFDGSMQLPQDRESVFWFNTLQIPPKNIEGDNQKNKMLITLRSRIKIFYRPVSLGVPGKNLENVKISGTKGGVLIENPTAWFISYSSAKIQINGEQYDLNHDMIPPFSKLEFRFKDRKVTPGGKTLLMLTYINDQGARISREHEVIY